MMKALNNNAHPLESLLQQHCPNGVEFKTLQELEQNKILNLGRGKIISQNDLKNCPGEYPVYSSSATKNGEIGKYGKYMFDDERITWSIDGGGKFFYRNHLKYSVTNVCGWIKVINLDELNPKFLFYVLINEWVKKKFNYTKKAHPSIIKKEYCIPIPPLEIQQKIVDILDAFTELHAELQAELQARRKQYEYYRNKLLSFEELEKRANAIGGGLKLVTLGEIGKISMCKRILKNQTKPSGDIPFYKIGTFGGVADSFIDNAIFNEFKEKFSYPQKGDILISASGTIGKAVIYQGESAYYQDSNIVWLKHDGTKLNNKFLFYCYQNTQWDKYVSKGGTITRLYNDNLRKVPIPLPPLAVQNEIVELLDKFDALANDLSAGLPAEIDARQKQYEHYRAQLLSFKEKCE